MGCTARWAPPRVSQLPQSDVTWEVKKWTTEETLRGKGMFTVLTGDGFMDTRVETHQLHMSNICN